MSNLLKTLFFSLALAPSANILAQAKPKLRAGLIDIPAITSVLEKNSKDLGTDFAMIIYKDGKDIYKREFGEMKTTQQENIGAASQWLTAALVMTFVEEGKISLDDRLGDYIPALESYSKGYITLRHCLTHTTGIETDLPSFRAAIKKKKYNTLEEEVNAIAKDRNLKSKQGTEFYYGNIGHNIAGRVLEIISKKNFDRLVRDRIGKHLGFKRTNFMSDDAYAENPSGGGKSSAEDYIKFLAMLLNKGQFNGKQVLTERSVNEILKLQAADAKIVYTSPLSQGNSYGLGCWIEEKDAEGNGILVNCPGISGTWPWIHRGKGYAAVVFTKSDSPDQKRTIFEEIRQVVEQSIQ
ncbi:serine hydrolase [Flavihumibacter sp. ZG627]|uniref:serine hydrolase domain-containing protein n=1 Tax=Flavihumibacter sp. ZG627 TaxID=1463156 RepID=UPI00057D38D5|nr:serine hydrolase domain-containing protein [Flavihumibacter sp. ZG627]KIC91605.1 hypothetical protein HY58_05040 [Flavihumibacter sp. ZG627]